MHMTDIYRGLYNMFSSSSLFPLPYMEDSRSKTLKTPEYMWLSVSTAPLMMLRAGKTSIR